MEPPPPNCIFCGPRLNQAKISFFGVSKPNAGKNNADTFKYIRLSSSCPFRSRSLFGNVWPACAKQKRQRGFTALELIVVLIVGMGIIALAASKMDLLFSKSNAFEEISNVSTLFANLKTLKTASGYGAKNTNLIPQLLSIKGIPQNMSISDGALSNIWGGRVTVTSTGLGFSIHYDNVPKDACIKLATQANRGGAWTSAKVNGAAAVTGEYPSARAHTDCSSDTGNKIIWATRS